MQKKYQQSDFSPTFSHAQQKILAIMEFIHNYDEDVSMNTLLNGFSFYKVLTTNQRSLLIHPSNQIITQILENFSFHCQIRPSASSWGLRLINHLNILTKIEEYTNIFYTNSKKVILSDIDLISLCKYQDEGQIIKVFEILMTILIQSSNKDQHIQRIMQLQPSSQEYFVDIIKNSLESRLKTIQQQQQKQQMCLNNSLLQLCSRIIEQYQIDMKSIENHNFTLQLTNSELQSQLTQTIQEINLSYKKSSILDNSYEDTNKIAHLQEKIKALKQKLILNQRKHQTQKQNLEHQLSILQTQKSKYSQIQQICQFYKQKYQSVMDQVKAISIWKKEKIKFQKIIQEKEFMICKMQERIQEIQQKNSILQQRQLESTLNMQSKNIMIEKMQEEVKLLRDKFGEQQPIRNRSRSNRRKGGRGLTLFGINQPRQQKQNNILPSHNQFSNRQEQIQPNKYTIGITSEVYQLQKQNEQNRQKIKKLEKQLKKTEYKNQKMRAIEEQKKKLEILVYDLTMNQNQQVKLLVSVLVQNYQLIKQNNMDHFRIVSKSKGKNKDIKSRMPSIVSIEKQ